MSKKWVMRLIDDISIPHWIIEEEVKELPNTHKRIGFCDAQEDAELIITAPKLQEENKRLRKLLKRCNKILEHAPEFPFYLIAKYDIEDLQNELEQEINS